MTVFCTAMPVEPATGWRPPTRVDMPHRPLVDRSAIGRHQLAYIEEYEHALVMHDVVTDADADADVPMTCCGRDVDHGVVLAAGHALDADALLCPRCYEVFR